MAASEVKRSIRYRVLFGLGILVGLALFVAALLWFVAWAIVEVDNSRTPPGHPELSDQQ